MDESLAPTAEQFAANPLLMVLWLALSGWFLLFFSSFFVAWSILGYRFFNGLKTLSILPWRPRQWSGIELLLAFVLMVICQVVGVVGFMLIYGMNQEEFSAMAAEEVPLGLSAAISGLYLVACTLLTLWICARFRVTLSHVGWTSDLWRILKVGVVGSAAIVPLIFLLNAITAQLGGVDYEHPLFEAMEDGGGLTKFCYALVAAAIVAPLAEEFLFRGLLQGWLQSMSFHSMSRWLFGVDLSPAQSAAVDATPDLAGEQALASTQSENPFAAGPLPGGTPRLIDSQNPFSVGATIADPQKSARLTAEEFLRGDSIVDPSSVVPPIWPSVVAGLLFGLAHWGYGLSWIPLSVFGFALGLLYRATHSIWPSVIVHFAMNATSIFAMGVMMYTKTITG